MCKVMRWQLSVLAFEGALKMGAKTNPTSHEQHTGIDTSMREPYVAFDKAQQ